MQPEPDITVKVLRLRCATLDALLWEDWAKLRVSVKALSGLDLDGPVLAETGVGALLSDETLDRHLGPVEHGTFWRQGPLWGASIRIREG